MTASTAPRKPKVAFICVHNSCRSQIAEALGKQLAGDVFESYSAGTVVADRINPDAQRIMLEQYGIDMEGAGQHSKLLDEIPRPDVAIFMGCEVSCPTLSCPWTENWGLDDPSGQCDDRFRETMSEIERRVTMLASSIAFRLK